MRLALSVGSGLALPVCSVACTGAGYVSIAFSLGVLALDFKRPKTAPAGLCRHIKLQVRRKAIAAELFFKIFF